MKATDALPAPYEEVLIWWDSTSGMQRRVARLDASGNSFQLSTFMSSTKGQYLAPIGQVVKWEPIVSGSEITTLTAENAALRADLNDARSNWESGAEELRQADLVRAQLVAALQDIRSKNDKLISLARRTMWIAYVWNDHNFEAAHKVARETCEAAGIQSFEAANVFLAALQADGSPANGAAGQEGGVSP